MKPVRLPAAATLALPRLGLFALCLFYILPGLIGRDPWKLGGDAASFGVMWTMAHGTLQDWLWPHIGNLPVPEEGPLTFWIGALCIKLFGWLVGDDAAARISSILFFGLGAASVWYATYALGRRQEAQPLQLAFGGQPEPQDFGRTLADGALLIYLGSLGMLIHSHLTSPVALQISLVAFVLYIAIRLFDLDPEQPTPCIKFALLLGIALGLLILTRGWLIPLTLWLTCLLIAGFRYKKLLVHLGLVTFPVAFAIMGIWLLSCKYIQPFDSSPYAAWMNWNKHEFFRPSYSSLHYFVKYSAWFTWPAWPFAGWAVYAWRKQTTALHIALPLSFLVALVLLAFCSPYAEQSSLIPLIPPLSILAAFGLPTMKRGAINAVDWFSVLFFSMFATFIWLSWIAMQTGWPVQLHHNVFKNMPGFVAQFDLIPFLIALLSTAAWLKLVHWRISRQPRVLWRAVVLSSSGVILCWLLSMALWTPWIDYRVSYQNVAKDIAAQLPTTYNCVDTNINATHRASFAYFGNIRFSDFNVTKCDFYLTEKHVDKSKKLVESNAVWKGHRASDKSELFLLFKNKD
ncbi:ArnT family glycosyltransferase [Sapientia aquatica]|uniref:Glycosyltransferase n=1 Tax=Sapientia aquatica TaxID=1549640 RepID=A0A4V3AV34_9BURK|nr:glycosyltransferase [Sapientia aquatica]TDK67986.1 glycosyltransferase [Sapientia aquatica]